MEIYVVEDNWQRCLTRIHRFRDGERALEFLAQRERELFPWDGPERVCYFRADSIEALRVTHGNWFHAQVEVVDG